MATVVLPRSLVALFPGAVRRETVAGATVSELLVHLDRRIPGLRDRLADGRRLRPHINVYVDGQPAGLSTAVPEDAVVHVIPAVSGGA
jgi:molybdopterin converting factor small subunit